MVQNFTLHTVRLCIQDNTKLLTKPVTDLLSKNCAIYSKTFANAGEVVAPWRYLQMFLYRKVRKVNATNAMLACFFALPTFHSVCVNLVYFAIRSYAFSAVSI